MKNLSHILLAIAASVASLAISVPAHAGDAIFSKGEVQSEPSERGLPKVLKGVSIDQHLNQQIDLSLPVHDEQGRTVPIGSFFGKRPAIFVMAYYECPMLCTRVMNGVFGSMKALPFEAGKDFDVICVSINPKDTPALALRKKNTYLTGYHQQAYAGGYHFLTADQPTITKLADEVGFRYKYDSTTKQFAHASGIMLVTPEGRLSRYLYGIEYAPLNMKLGLIDASHNKIGSVVDAVQLYCYCYDPATGTYGLVVANLLKIGGGLMLAFMGLFFWAMHRRSKKRAKRAESNAQIQLGNLA